MATQADVNLICELAERSLTIDDDEVVGAPAGYDLDEVRAAIENVRAAPFGKLSDAALGRVADEVQRNAFDEWTLEQQAQLVEPMTPADAATAQDFIDAGRGLGLASSIQVMSELAWLRGRFLGDRSDIDRTGVTIAMCRTYAKAYISKGSKMFRQPNWSDPATFPREAEWPHNIDQGHRKDFIVSRIQVLARVRGLCFLDTLDEILEAQ